MNWSASIATMRRLRLAAALFGCAAGRVAVSAAPTAAGAGNPGAVGVKFDSAQDSFLEDMHTAVASGDRGIVAIPGRGMGANTVGVTGGRIGLNLESTSLGAAVVGVMLAGLGWTGSGAPLLTRDAVSLVFWRKFPGSFRSE